MPTIYDAVEVSAIPADAKILLAYIDGNYNTYSQIKNRFPTATVLTVTTTGRNRADICDVESGDATPSIAARGVSLGLYPTVYSSLSTYGELVQAMGPHQPWQWFAASWTGTPHNVQGAVATQYASPFNHTSPGNYDISITDSTYPYTIPSIPRPLPPTGKPMPVSAPIVFTNEQHVLQVSYDTLWHKWFTGTWHNEVVASPTGGVSTVHVTLPDQTPQVTVINKQLLVTVEDAGDRVYYFALNESGSWGCNELP